jgi:hypothetical protein
VSFIHAAREFSSFVPGPLRPYLLTVQKETTGPKGNTMTEYEILTAAELYALELQARRARSHEIARLISAGVSLAKQGFKAVFTRPYAPRQAKRVSHA